MAFRNLLPLLALFALATTCYGTQPQGDQRHAKTLDLTKEPIAYIGHGALFDRNGKEIRVTPEFASNAQDFYLSALLDAATAEERAAYELKSKSLLDGKKRDSPDALFVKSALIQWLLRELQPANAATVKGKTSLLRLKVLKGFTPSESLAAVMKKEGIL